MTGLVLIDPTNTSFERSGGGGYGASKDRPAEVVMDDVRNGYVSLHAAADVYGQPLELKDGQVDVAQVPTQLRRQNAPEKTSATAMFTITSRAQN